MCIKRKRKAGEKEKTKEKAPKGKAQLKASKGKAQKDVAMRHFHDKGCDRARHLRWLGSCRQFLQVRP